MVEIKNTQIIKKRKRNVSSGSRPDFLFWCEKYYPHSGLYRNFVPFIQFFLNGNAFFYARIFKMHCRNLYFISNQ